MEDEQNGPEPTALPNYFDAVPQSLSASAGPLWPFRHAYRLLAFLAVAAFFAFAAGAFFDFLA
jgi:hypothetical protein